MLTFLISLYCPKACHGPDHSLRFVEYHRKKLLFPLNPTSSPRFELRTVFCFVTLVPIISSPKQFCSLHHSSVVLSFRGTETPFNVNRTQDSFRSYGICFCNLLFETNNFDLGAVLPPCLVSELQEARSPGFELRTIFPEFWSFCILFLVSRNNRAKFGANRHIRSWARSEHKYTICFICKIEMN
jgi:hypothetical protein